MADWRIIVNYNAGNGAEIYGPCQELFETRGQAIATIVDYILTGGDPDNPDSFEADIRIEGHEDHFMATIDWHDGAAWEYWPECVGR